MKQSPAQQLEEMHATFVRAISVLESQEIAEAHRLLSLLQGMIEGAHLPRRSMAGGGADTVNAIPSTEQRQLALTA